MLNIFKKYWYVFSLLLIILFGVFLRLKGLLINPSMWHDECALGWNIRFKNYSDFFGILRFMQMAPPFFMVATKLTTKIFGLNDIVLRLLPFLAGIASLIAFYFLASTNLKFKFAVLCAVFFFAINQQLINYSFEFKPYNIDVLFTIICLLFFINLNMQKISTKKTFFYGLLLAIVPWFSFVSVFTIAGGFLNLFFKHIKSDWRKKLLLALPIMISGLIYLKIYLMNNYTGTHMVNYWQNSFVNANPFFFLHLLVENMKYFFFPSQYALFMLILLIWGAVIFLREKSPFINISLTSFILLIVASFLHFYPFSSRLVLFLVPIFLLLILKPLDLISSAKRFRSFIIIALALFTFFPQIIQTADFIRTKNISKGENPREMMEFLVKNLKEGDIIVVNNASNTEFEYYSSFYNIENKIFRENLANKPDASYLSLLDNFPKGHYWFYLPFDYSHTKVIPFILQWAKTKKILYSYKNNTSVLINVYIKD